MANNKLSLKNKLKIFGISAGSVVLVGGGVATAAIFFVDNSNPFTGTTYSVDNFKFRSVSDAQKFIREHSTKTLKPVYNETVYQTLTEAWFKAATEMNFTRDYYLTSDVLPEANNSFVEMRNKNSLLNTDMYKTVYAVSKIDLSTNKPEIDPNTGKPKFMVYGNEENASRAWNDLNEYKAVRSEKGNVSYEFKTEEDDEKMFEEAFEGRTMPGAIKLDSSIAELKINKDIYDALFYEDGELRGIVDIEKFPDSLTQPTDRDSDPNVLYTYHLRTGNRPPSMPIKGGWILDESWLSYLPTDGTVSEVIFLSDENGKKIGTRGTTNTELDIWQADAIAKYDELVANGESTIDATIGALDHVAQDWFFGVKKDELGVPKVDENGEFTPIGAVVEIAPKLVGMGWIEENGFDYDADLDGDYINDQFHFDDYEQAYNSLIVPNNFRDDKK